MRLIILILLLINMNFGVMAQRISFRSKGLSILEIGISLSDINTNKYDRIEKNKNIHPTYRGSFEDKFKYYFIDSDTMFIEGVGLIKDIFFASDYNDVVRSIFIVFESVGNDISNAIDQVFDKALAQSHSSIDNNDTNSKKYWKKNEISVTLTSYFHIDFSKVIISDTKFDEKSPWIDIVRMYK